jgi:hypothetical protein
VRIQVFRRAALAGVVLGLVGLAPVTAAFAAKGSATSAPTCPSFSSSNFHRPTTISNTYFPLVTGTRFTYKGNLKKQDQVNVLNVTRNTPTIDGILTVEVRDQVSLSGTLIEDTLDWFAQDDQGNVWYMGEFATQVPAGTHTGSWTAGINGAQPGYIMEAAPKVGDTYCQENAPGIAQDAAQVLSVTASRSVPFGTFTGNVLQTKDYSLIEVHSENKFYGPSVGLLEAIAINGGSEDIQLYTIEHF